MEQFYIEAGHGLVEDYIAFRGPEHVTSFKNTPKID